MPFHSLFGIATREDLEYTMDRMRCTKYESPNWSYASTSHLANPNIGCSDCLFGSIVTIVVRMVFVQSPNLGRGWKMTFPTR